MSTFEPLPGENGINGLRWTGSVRDTILHDSPRRPRLYHIL